VDLSLLAAEVAARLQEQEPQREVDLRIAQGLRAWADAGLLRVVLDNLLSNAWKFTRHTPKPRIEVGITECRGSQTFFVRDNGAGFDMARADRLFGAFVRLHSERAFPGSGVGLATVKRVIARHGGQVWAEAKVNQGAVFYFTLPAGPGQEA